MLPTRPTLHHPLGAYTPTTFPATPHSPRTPSSRRQAYSVTFLVRQFGQFYFATVSLSFNLFPLYSNLMSISEKTSISALFSLSPESKKLTFPQPAKSRYRSQKYVLLSQADRQGLAVLMVSAVVVLKHENSTLRQRHNFISFDLTFCVSDYVREVTSPDKVGSGPMSGQDATWG